MDKNTRITIISVAALALIGWALYVGYSFYQQDSITVEKENKQVVNREMKNAFVEGCSEEGTLELCECYYDVIVEDLGLNKMIEESISYETTGVISNRMNESLGYAVTICGV